LGHKEPDPRTVEDRSWEGVWVLETEEFHEEMSKNAEDTHLKEMEEWEALKNVPKTALQFHQ